MQNNVELTSATLKELRAMLKAEAERSDSENQRYLQKAYAEDIYDADKYLVVREIKKAPYDDVYYFMLFHDENEPCILHTVSNTMIEAYLAMTRRMIIDNCESEDTVNSVISKKASVIRNQFDDIISNTVEQLRGHHY